MISHPPLLDPLRARALLQGICADRGWRVLEVRSVELVKERPGARLTFRYRLVTEHGTGPPRETVWYGQAYQGPEGERAFRAIHMLRLAAPPSIRFPEPLGYSPEARLLLMSSLPGTSLADALRRCSGEALAAILTYVGGALARLHALGAAFAKGPAGVIERRHGAEEEREGLRRARARVASARLGAAFHHVCDQVMRDLERGPASREERLGPAHRQLHPDAVIVDSGGIGLLDPDEVVLGEPELDLGHLVAHLVADDYDAHGALRAAPERVEALEAGYAAIAPVDRDRLASYTAAALLRLAATEPEGAFRPSALDDLRFRAALVDEASCLESMRRLC